MPGWTREHGQRTGLGQPLIHGHLVLHGLAGSWGVNGMLMLEGLEEIVPV